MSMTPMSISDVRLLAPTRHADARGWFSETWRRDALQRDGIQVSFVQENEAFSSATGTIRGLHYQQPPSAQAKLIRVVAGAIFDVAVDIRRGSPTYGRWVSVTLTAATGEQLFIPRGFAHGYCTTAPNTRVAYLVDDYYSQDCERGLAFDDPALGINWPIRAEEALLSARDRRLPRLAELDTQFET